KARKKGVRAKLSTIPEEFEGRNVLLVDDSIVRGTTSREIVLMAKEAGAKKVFFASCAPPITNAHIYGIDLASSSELIAHHRTSADIATHIGADAVIYQSLPDLEAACAQLSPRDPKTQKFEVGVFCGKYVTPVADDYFEHLEHVRGETRKLKVMENAREAVMQGTAGEEEVRMAANGVEVDDSGEVVAAGSEDGQEVDPITLANGVGKRKRDEGDEQGVARRGSDGPSRASQDISLHNLNDD
ncbi:amidophosphoribosyltransferase, partial [Cryomyces antarcticus]